MEAAKLVERRKAGEITQEDFFVKLNELRRANSSGTRRSSVLRAGRRSSSGPEGVESTPSKDEGHIGCRRICSGGMAKAVEEVGNESALHALATDGCEEPSTGINRPEKTSELRPQDNSGGTSFRSLPTQESRCQDCTTSARDVELPAGGPSEAVAIGVRSATTVVVADTKVQNSSRTDIQLDENVADDEGALSIAAAHTQVVSPTQLVSTPTCTASSPRGAGASSFADEANAVAEVGHRHRELALPIKSDRDDEDSNWLESPRSEHRSSPRQRKTRASRGACSGNTKGCGDGERRYQSMGGRGCYTRRVASSPERRWTGHGSTVSRQQVSPGVGRSNPHHNGSKRNAIEQSPTMNPAPGSRPVIIAERRSNGRLNGESRPDLLRRQRQRVERSPGLSKLDEARKRILVSPNRREQALSAETWRDVRTEPKISPQQAATCPSWPGLWRSYTRADDEVSVRSLPCGTPRRGNRLQRGQSPQRSHSTDRKVSGSASVGSLEYGVSIARYPSRRDRYGYPLHERGGLGTSTVALGRDEIDHLRLFAPMIKTLPSFYRSRPRRTGDPFGRSIADCGRANEIRRGSVFTRSKRWLAKAEDDRTRRLTILQERELGACTFQPNARPRSAPPLVRPKTSCSGNAASSDVVHTGSSRVAAGGAVSQHSGGVEILEQEQRPSGRESNKGVKGKSRSLRGAEIGQRLFMESKRLKERRFEGEERKRMGEEEAYARSCTFQPILTKPADSLMAGVRARYREVPRRPAAGSAGQQVLDKSCTFRPQIVGVQPGMARAREYISLDVSQRLHQLHCRNLSTRQGPAFPTRTGSRAAEHDGRGHGAFSTEGCGIDDAFDSRRHQDRGAPIIPRSEGRDTAREFDRFEDEDQAPSPEDHGRKHPHPLPIGIAEPNRLRPGSAPSGIARDSDDKRYRNHVQHGPPNEGFGRQFRERGKGGGYPRSCAGGGASFGRGGMGFERSRSAGRGGSGPLGPCLRRQNPISFGEFLARQAHSQAMARKRLGHLTRMHSPSFTPQLSSGSRRIAAKCRGGAAFGGGGCFEDRLKVTARRRHRDRKAALQLATQLEEKECTFSPELTPQARLARSRSARELSIGDAVLRQAKQRMVKARRETRLLEDDHHDDRRGFWPRLETAGDALAPQALSRLRLAEELDTYLDRLKEEAVDREQYLAQQRHQALAEEKQRCTFQPSIRDCPALVKRTAEGMRRIREFRRNEALLSLIDRPPPPPARPTWK